LCPGNSPITPCMYGSRGSRPSGSIKGNYLLDSAVHFCYDFHSEKRHE
jgi:hypothetical protein